MKFQTQWRRSDKRTETVVGKSLTVPDQTMSIPEILRRYATGLPVGGHKTAIWDGEEDILDGVNPKTLDLSERHELEQQFTEELIDLKKKQARKNKPTKQLDLETVIEEVQKRMNITPPSTPSSAAPQA